MELTFKKRNKNPNNRKINFYDGKKLIASVKDLSRIITKSKVRNKEQTEKYNSMVDEMVKNGYCSHCCDVVLKYAANNLWRD